VGNIKSGFTRLLLISCAVGSMLSLPAHAAGDGVIVLQRDVQPHAAGRAAFQPDPYPTTVNANPSARINSELNDGDFAGISSGSSISNSISDGSSLPGLNVVTNPNGLPGMANGHGGGSGATISNSINRAITSGMSPLSNIGGGK